MIIVDIRLRNSTCISKVENTLQTFHHHKVMLLTRIRKGYRYSTQATVDVVQILYKIKKTGLYENEKKKLQKVMNHYAIEYDNMIVIKP